MTNPKFYTPSKDEPIFRIGPCESCGAETRWIIGRSPTCGERCAARYESLRRLQPAPAFSRFLGDFPSADDLPAKHSAVAGDTATVGGSTIHVYTGSEWRRLESA